MNSTVISGILKDNGRKILVNTNHGEKAMVYFNIVDKGMPYKKQEMSIEVNSLEESALHILPYLRSGKEVIVFGVLMQKKFLHAGKETEKYYISAKLIQLVGELKDEAKAKSPY